MEIVWGTSWQRARKGVKTGWLVVAGIVAVYVGAIQPYKNARRVAEQKYTGLGAVAWDPASYWRPASLRHMRRVPQLSMSPMMAGGVVGEIVGNADKNENADLIADAAVPGPPPPPPNSSEDRKMVRTTEMDLIVKSPAETVAKIRQLTEQLGGFLVSSEINGEQDAGSAALTIRIPGARFEETEQGIRKLGLRVESEKVNAEDVTRQYVDEEADLRNLHAQETQYFGILQQAKSVKDTLEVSEKLNAVRGQIERQQAEHEALSKQVETVAITVSLRAEADAQVFGLHWRPLYQLKLSAREGLDGLGSYVAAMVSFCFYLPTVLLWLMTILIGSAIGWRILRWSALTLFARAKTA
jgi:Domain of unknown function (DUF4349)